MIHVHGTLMIHKLLCIRLYMRVKVPILRTQSYRMQVQMSIFHEAGNSRNSR